MGDKMVNTTAFDLNKHAHNLSYYWLLLRIRLMRAVLMGPLYILCRLQIRGMPTGVHRYTTSVPSRDKGRTIKVHRFDPPGYQTGQVYPVHLNVWGSGIAPYSLFSCADT